MPCDWLERLLCESLIVERGSSPRSRGRRILPLPRLAVVMFSLCLCPGTRERKLISWGSKPTGAKTETPKASSGEEYGEGVSPSHRTRELGERRELPSGVRSGAPAQNEFGAF